MNRQESSTSNNRRRSSVSAAAALFVTTCGIVGVAVARRHAMSSSASPPSASSPAIETEEAAAATLRSTRGVVLDDNDENRRRRRQHLSRTLPATSEESAADCSGMKRRQCRKDPRCKLSGDVECVPKSAARPVEVDPCSLIASKSKCKKNGRCRYNRKKGYCYSKQPKGKGGSDPTLTNDPNQVVITTEPTVPILGDPMPQLDSICGSQHACHEKGDACAVGTETCCGVTHNSVECTCEENKGGLRYICMYTDACMRPSCCQSGPPADMPPPAYGTCQLGGLCETGVEDDYCCYDETGWAGTFCTKSGGKTAMIEGPGESSGG